MSDKLLPCPFCGDEAVYNTEGYIECAKCCALGPMGGESRAKAWNTRSNPSRAQLAAARSALEKARTYIEYALDTHGNDVAGTGLAALNAIDATLAQEPAGQSEAKCARCGFERKEHSYNGACYGLCGEFIASPAGSASPGGTAEPATVSRDQLAEDIHYGLGGNGWAYTDYSGDELNECRDRLLSAADAVLVRFAAHPTVKVSGDASARFTNDEAAVLPEGYAAPLSVKSTFELANEAAQKVSGDAAKLKEPAWLPEIARPLYWKQDWCQTCGRGWEWSSPHKRRGDAAEMRERCAQLMDRWANDAAEFANESKRCEIQRNVCRNASVAIRALPLTPEGRSDG